MENKKNVVEYERPRCKVLLRMPFGLFIARRVRLNVEHSVEPTPIYEH